MIIPSEQWYKMEVPDDVYNLEVDFPKAVVASIKSNEDGGCTTH